MAWTRQDFMNPQQRNTLFSRQQVTLAWGFIFPHFHINSFILHVAFFLCSFQTGPLLTQRGPLPAICIWTINILYSPQCFMHILTEQCLFCKLSVSMMYAVMAMKNVFSIKIILKFQLSFKFCLFSWLY